PTPVAPPAKSGQGKLGGDKTGEPHTLPPPTVSPARQTSGVEPAPACSDPGTLWLPPAQQRILPVDQLQGVVQLPQPSRAPAALPRTPTAPAGESPSTDLVSPRVNTPRRTAPPDELEGK